MTHAHTTRLYFCAALLSLLSLLFSANSLAGKPLKLGEKAPNWILTSGENQQVSFYQDSSDQAAVILFWATWCPYCRELMPELKAIQAELKNTQVKFYALNVWEDGDAPAYMAKNNYDFILLLNADVVAKRYNIHGTPGLVVVDKDKIVRYIRDKGTTATEAAANVKQALIESDQ